MDFYSPIFQISSGSSIMNDGTQPPMAIVCPDSGYDAFGITYWYQGVQASNVYYFARLNTTNLSVYFDLDGLQVGHNGSSCSTASFGDGTALLSDYYPVVFLEEGSGGGGSASSSPYYIDVGSTVMLGGILAFFVSYWMVGLVRSRKQK